MKLLAPVRVLAAALVLGFAGAALTGCATAPRPVVQDSAVLRSVPEPRREFRAAWVATVANIDWPSQTGLTTDQQKAEAIRILDRAASMNLNAIVFQVRPHADALYKSELEPWSEYITGTQGKAPEPFYDPLEFWIEESHARGIQLHAWFNPYRSWHTAAKSAPAANSVTVTHPEWSKKLGKTWQWLDPANKQAQDHSYNVMIDVVNRYNVDAIHMDDYFYPYPDYMGKNPDGSEIDFPDDDSWAQYQASGGKLNRSDFRRKAVNDFIVRLSRGIKAAKPQVQFGISPFGIWQPGYPEGVVGFNQHEKLYADAKLWLNKSWVDYYTPQLYWPTTSTGQPYGKLLDWWNSETPDNVHMWPGNSISAVGTGEKDRPVSEIVKQIEETRAREKSTGNVFFSFKTFMANTAGLTDALATGVYADASVVPQSPWFDTLGPNAPTNPKSALSGSNLKLSWEQSGAELPFVHILSVKTAGVWTHKALAKRDVEIASDVFVKYTLENAEDVEAVAVRATDKNGNLTSAVLLYSK